MPNLLIWVSNRTITQIETEDDTSKHGQEACIPTQIKSNKPFSPSRGIRGQTADTCLLAETICI